MSTKNTISAVPQQDINLFGFKISEKQINFAATAAIFLLVAFVIFVMLSEPAAAQGIDTNPIQNFLQSLTDALTGKLGKTAATLALIAVGISWFFGVIDFRQAMWIIIAIVFVGSAPTIVNSLWEAAS